MEKRILLDLQIISHGAVPAPTADAAGGGVAPRSRPLQQAPAIALVFRKGFAQLLQLTIQPR